MRPAAPLLIALVGLVGLALVERGLEPEPVRLGEASRHEGGRVAVEGWVVGVRVGPRGSAIELADGEARLTVLAAGPPPASPGATVRVIGLVSRDGSAFVLSAQTVAVTAGPAAEPVGAVLAALADGRPVRAEGIHLRGHLRDGEVGLPLRGAEGAPEGPLRVEGLLRLDRTRAQFALEVAAWTRP